jgi:predicted phosphodiesterase
MRYLILSDLHSNLAALAAALEIIGDNYDRFVCLGDIVGYGPDPNQVTDRIRAMKPVAVVRGNHDKACCGITDASDFTANARAAALWSREQLTAENLDYLRGLPQGPKPVGDYQIVHGSVRDEDEYVFHPREAIESLALTHIPITFFGHTHMQGGFVLREENRVQVLRVSVGEGAGSANLELDPGAKYLINPGSIGQPRDGDPRAGFVFYDDHTHVVEYWRLPYDVQKTQKTMKEAKLPQALIDRLALGR